jgi:hypothetical protein
MSQAQFELNIQEGLIENNSVSEYVRQSVYNKVIYSYSQKNKNISII